MIKQNKKKGLQGIPSKNIRMERTKYINLVHSSGYKIISKEISATRTELNYLQHDVYDKTYLDNDHGFKLNQLSNQQFHHYTGFKEVFRKKLMENYKKIYENKYKKPYSGDHIQMRELVSEINREKVNLDIIIPRKLHKERFEHPELPENLFLEFANIPLTKEGVLGFAEKYGLLGFSNDNEYNDFHLDLKRIFGSEGESLMKWYHEIWHMRRILKIWSCCWDKKELEKKKYVDFLVHSSTEGMYLNPNDDEYYDNEDFTGESIHRDEEAADLITQFKYPKNEKPPAGMNQKYFIAYSDTHFGVSESELEKEISDYGVNKIKIIYLDHITNLINKFLAKRNFEFYTMAAVDVTEYKKISSSTNQGMENVRLLNNNILTPPNIERKLNANSLICELWCQCIEKLSSNITVKECKNCGKFFLEKRKDARFCSESCRNKSHYEDKAWERLKLDIKKNGLQTPIILKKIKHEYYKYRIVDGFRRFAAYSYFRSKDRNAKIWRKIPSQILKTSENKISYVPNIDKSILGKKLLIPLDEIDFPHAIKSTFRNILLEDDFGISIKDK